MNRNPQAYLYDTSREAGAENEAQSQKGPPDT